MFRQHLLLSQILVIFRKLLKKRLKRVEEAIQVQVDKLQTRSIEQLGLFVAFFTFISIEFQIIKSFDIKQFAAFTAYFAGILLLFVVIVDLLLKEIIDWVRIKIAILTLLFLFGISLYFIPKLQ